VVADHDDTFGDEAEGDQAGELGALAGLVYDQIVYFGSDRL
jgi:hypothetical protein